MIETLKTFYSKLGFLVFFCSVILFNVPLYGWQSAPQINTKSEDYLPPSPTAQEFMKYGEYPVGMYTGVPNISIPIYDVNTKDISVPISINYHSSGIQVDQKASWVGLGWSLNSGGTISRIPRGVPDDSGAGGFFNINVPELSQRGYDDQFFEDAATGLKDTESDVYYYNFAGFSGKFFFGRDKKVRMVDEAPITIEYESGGFIIVLQNGLVYKFNLADAERTQTSVYSFSADISRNYISTWHLSEISSPRHPNKVIFEYEDVNPIYSNFFEYLESTGNSFDLNPETITCPPTIITNIYQPAELSSQTHVQNNPKRIRRITFPNGKIEFNRAQDRLDGISDRLQEIVIFQKGEGSEFNTIRSFDFEIDHFYSNQTYVKSQIPLSDPNDPRRYRLKLVSLVEYDRNGNNPKTHSFFYNNTMLSPVESTSKDFWGYNNGKYNTTLIPLQPFQYLGQNVGDADREPDALYMKAGVLEKISYPTGGYTEFLFEPHEYQSGLEQELSDENHSVFARGDNSPYEDTYTFTPNYTGYATVWFESSDMTSSQGGTFPRVTLKKSGSSSYLLDHSITPYTYSFPLGNNTIQETLSPVQLVAGETYEFKVEVQGESSHPLYNNVAFISGEISYQDVLVDSVYATKIAGGLRVKEIRSYKEEGVFAFAKKYEYENASLITPERFLTEQYLDSEIEMFVPCQNSSGLPEVGCASSYTTRRFYYGGTVRDLTLQGGSSVVYGSVNEFIVNNALESIGKTNHRFTKHSDDVLQTFASYKGGVMLIDKGWNGGQLFSKTVYKNGSGGGMELIDSLYTSHIIKRDKYSVFNNAYKMYKIVHKRIISDAGCRLFDPSQYEIIEYPIYSGIKLVKSISHYSIDKYGNEIHLDTEIKYGNEIHLQPTEEMVISSLGDSLIVKKYYPDDIVSASSLSGGALSSVEFNAINKLKDTILHQIDIPVQVEEWKGDKKLTTKRVIFKEWSNGLILPELIKTSTESNPFVVNVKFLDYDNTGNPIMISKEDGVVTSYIWGYDKQYPIAKIVNATYSEIASALGVSVNSLKNYTEANMSAIDNLRSLLPNARVSSFTYIPLIGVVTEMDPNGIHNSYQYDDHTRLKSIIDHDGNLVKTFEYNYAVQN